MRGVPEEIDAMPLHEKLREIFLANESGRGGRDRGLRAGRGDRAGRFAHRRIARGGLRARSLRGCERAVFSDSLERFLVPDRGTDRNQLRVVLLVESPHTDEIGLSCEIDNRYPLAGPKRIQAGRHVRDKFMELRPELDLQPDLPEQPIGRLVHERHGTVQGLGIMNVNQLPFQVAPYIQYNNGVRQNRCWGDYITCMDFIRNNPDTIDYRGPHGGHLKTEINRLQCAIVDDLKRRLRILHGRSPCVLLVRCGEVAKNFHEKTDVNMPHTRDLPHPARREGWDNLTNCQGECLQEIFGRLWPNPT